MKRTLPTLPLLVLSVFFLCAAGWPNAAWPQTFYVCTTQDGDETTSDHPLYGQTCKALRSQEEPKSPQPRNGEPVQEPLENNRKTKITVRGNQILVPVTVAYEDREVEAQLVLDTGAMVSIINSDVSDQLYIKLYNAPKAKARVVGGAVIDVSVIRLKSLTIGPHTIPNCTVAVVVNEGDAPGYDGLLGMDLLKGYSFRIDIANGVIVWM